MSFESRALPIDIMWYVVYTVVSQYFFKFMIDLLPAPQMQCTRDVVWQLVADVGIAHLVSSPDTTEDSMTVYTKVL